MNTSINKDISAKSVRFQDEKLFILLSDSREIEVSLQKYPLLLNANEKERNNWRLIGNGKGIHWEDVDEDLSVEGFLSAPLADVSDINKKTGGKFEIYKDKSGKFRFRLKASDGRVILGSEAYESKSGCINGIESVITNAEHDTNYDLRESNNGSFYFIIKAKNHQIIGQSEYYKSARERDSGIELVKTNVKNAHIIDLSLVNI